MLYSDLYICSFQAPDKLFKLYSDLYMCTFQAPDKLSKLTGASPPGSDVTNPSDDEDDVTGHARSVPQPRSPRKRHASPDRQEEKSEPAPPSVHLPGEGDLSFQSLDKGQTLTSVSFVPNFIKIINMQHKRGKLNENVFYFL